MLDIEIIFIDVNKTIFQQAVLMPAKATVIDAICKTQIAHLYPEVMTLPVGIFSKIVTHATQLHTGDRIEIYRPLITDPKTKRRIVLSKNYASNILT